VIARFPRRPPALRDIGLPFLLIAVTWTGAPCKKPPLPEAFAELRNVQSPDRIVLSRMPPQYTVPVTLSGGIADDMEKALRSAGLEQPSYIEILDKDRRFHLLLANRSYSFETRDLLSGVLNPAEMIDIVMSSALRYRQEDKFREIAEQTVIRRTPGRRGDTATITFELVPKGKYFAYSYEDRGAVIRESWLSGLVCMMDSGSGWVRRLMLRKCGRTFSADQTAKPPVDSSVFSYTFSYNTFDGVVLPASLELSVNGVKTLTLDATYRWQNRYMVFNTRKIAYVNPRNPAAPPACLLMTYGPYRLAGAPPSLRQNPSPDRYAQNLEKAARLSRAAQNLLRTGSVDAAIQTLGKVIADFPETPQAVEARGLLDGLPGGTVGKGR
jgi:hypothetical protein